MKRQDFFFGSWQRNWCYTWKAVINKYTMEQSIGGECFYALTTGPLSTVILREGKDKRWGLHMPQLSAKGPYSYSMEEKCWPRRAAACLNSRGRVPSGQRMGIFRAGCWEQGAVLRVHTRYLPGDYLRVVGGVWAILAMVRLGEAHQKSPAAKITEWKYQR